MISVAKLITPMILKISMKTGVEWSDIADFISYLDDL